MNASGHRPGAVARMVLVLIHAYSRFLSPLLGANCRFHPTCSSYTAQAVELHGAVHGLWLGVRRIGRCHPWNAGGMDPVPGAPVDADAVRERIV